MARRKRRRKGPAVRHPGKTMEDRLPAEKRDRVRDAIVRARLAPKDRTTAGLAAAYERALKAGIPLEEAH